MQQRIQSKITGACSYCAGAYEVTDALKKADIAQIDELKGHPSFKGLIEEGFTILTFCGTSKRQEFLLRKVHLVRLTNMNTNPDFHHISIQDIDRAMADTHTSALHLFCHEEDCFVGSSELDALPFENHPASICHATSKQSLCSSSS